MSVCMLYVYVCMHTHTPMCLPAFAEYVVPLIFVVWILQTISVIFMFNADANNFFFPIFTIMLTYFVLWKFQVT